MYDLHFNGKEIYSLPEILFCRTIPFAWNLLTAGYIEQSIYGVCSSSVDNAILFFGFA
jgi:hypothetical protein